MVSLSRKGLVHGIMPPFLRVALHSDDHTHTHTYINIYILLLA